MSTHATISKLEADGSVTSVYCQYDGYTEYVGKFLKGYYLDEESVDQLLALGSIVSLAANVHPDEKYNHTIDDPQVGVTVSFFRDKREPMRISQYVDFQEYQNYGCAEEFNYIYVDGNWTVSTNYGASFKKYDV